MELKRTLDPALAAAIAGPFFFPVVLVDLDWPDAPLRMHSGAGSISWGGHTWTGVGKFGSVEVPEESASGVPVDFAMALVCDLPELAAYADAVVRQRLGSVFLGATTSAGGNTLIGAPAEIASGTMDTLVLTTDFADGGAAYELRVGLTTGPGYRTAASISHSHEDQSRQFPADTAGKKLVLAQSRAEKTLWPAP